MFFKVAIPFLRPRLFIFPKWVWTK